MKKDSSLIIIRLELTEKIIENKTFFIAVMKKADENSRKSLLAIEVRSHLCFIHDST